MQVSVVMPAYNAAATIAETLESLLAQTYPDWEACRSSSMRAGPNSKAVLSS
ncbi:MAG: glycosyltransferase family 2 protein [Candidatus Promineifilaceae bacterium]